MVSVLSRSQLWGIELSSLPNPTSIITKPTNDSYSVKSFYIMSAYSLHFLKILYRTWMSNVRMGLSDFSLGKLRYLLLNIHHSINPAFWVKPRVFFHKKYTNQIETRNGKIDTHFWRPYLFISLFPPLCILSPSHIDVIIMLTIVVSSRHHRMFVVTVSYHRCRFVSSPPTS